MTGLYHLNTYIQLDLALVTLAAVQRSDGVFMSRRRYDHDASSPTSVIKLKLLHHSDTFRLAMDENTARYHLQLDASRVFSTCRFLTAASGAPPHRHTEPYRERNSRYRSDVMATPPTGDSAERSP